MNWNDVNIFFVGGKPGKKGKKKGSDSDSDEDWGKNKKAPGSTAKKGGGGKGKGGGYTRAITLSPELAAVVGAEQMARHEVVKKVWSIIKERNLYVSIIYLIFSYLFSILLFCYILEITYYYILHVCTRQRLCCQENDCFYRTLRINSLRFVMRN